MGKIELFWQIILYTIVLEIPSPKHHEIQEIG
jgi:hypothetical protein